MTKSIKKNTVYNMVKTVSSIAFPLITFPYASRVLLPEGIGKVNFGLSVVSYFALLASLGITTHAVRECALHQGDREKLGNVASEIFSINMCTTLVAYALLALTLVFFRELDEYRFLIILQSSTILLTTLGCDWLNTAMEDFKFITLRTVGFQVVSLVLLFALVHTQDDYMIYAAISVIASGGANLVNMWYRRRYCKVRLTPRMRWRYHLAPILLLFAMMIAQTIFGNIDVTMLGLMVGDREAGICSTAHKISGVVSQLVAALAWVIMPRLSVYFAEGDYESANGLLRKVLGFNVTLGFPLAVGVLMIADDAIIAFAGQEFAASASVLRILMVGFVISLFGGSFLGNAIMLPSKNEKHFMVACILAAIVNVALNALLIPMYGAVGAAVATAACALVIFLYLLAKVDRRIHIERLGKLLLSPIAGCAAIVLVCLACFLIPNMWIRLLVSIACSAVVYMAVMVLAENEFATEILSIAKAKFTRS